MENLNDGTGATYVNSMYIMYYSLRYYKEETQLVRLFFRKGVAELVVKILDKYTDKEFLKILF